MSLVSYSSVLLMNFKIMNYASIVPIHESVLFLSPLISYFEFGSNVTLFCDVTTSVIDLKIRTKVNIKWIKDHTKSTLKSDSCLEYGTEFALTLNNIKLSDAGKYNCTYYLTSASNNPYIKSSVTSIASTNLTVKSKFFVTFISINALAVPNDVKPAINSLQVSPHSVGSNIRLFCNVNNLNYDISTNANLQWSDSFGRPLKNLSASNNLSYTINSIKLSDAGQYNCLSYVTTTVPHPYILTSKGTTAATFISVISKSTISFVHFCYFIL